MISTVLLPAETDRRERAGRIGNFGRTNGRRSHPPFQAVDGLPDLRQLAPRLEDGRPLHVSEEIAGPHLDGGVVAELVRIPDFVPDGLQLAQRLAPGARAHPIQPGDLLRHRLLDQLRHPERVFLRLRGKSPAHELLAQRLAQVVVHEAHAPLPARRHLGHAAQGFRVEGEARVDEPAGKIGRARAGQVPLQIALPGVEVLRAELRIQRFEELGFGDVERVQPGKAHALEVAAPVQRRRQRLELGPGHAVVELVGVAPIHSRERRLGQSRLHLHDRARGGGRLADQLEDLAHMLEVALPGLLRFRVLVEVVVAVREPETAGIDEGDHLRGVPEVLGASEGEHQAAAAGGKVQGRQQAGDLLHGPESGDLLQRRLEGSDSKLLHRRFVHAGGEEVADLLLYRRPSGTALGRFLEDSPEELLVLVGQLAVDAPARLIGRNGVPLHPAAAAELVELHAGIGRSIQRGQIQARRIGQSAQRSFRRGCRSEGSGRRRLRGLRLLPRIGQGRRFLCFRSRGRRGGGDGGAGADQRDGERSTRRGHVHGPSSSPWPAGSCRKRPARQSCPRGPSSDRPPSDAPRWSGLPRSPG